MKPEPKISSSPDAYRPPIFITLLMIVIYAFCMSWMLWLPVFQGTRTFLILAVFAAALILYLKDSSYGNKALAVTLLLALAGAVFYRGGVLNDYFGAAFEAGMLACPLLLMQGRPSKRRSVLFLFIFLIFAAGSSGFFFLMQWRAYEGRQALEKTEFTAEIKSPKFFKVLFPDEKWKVVDPAVAEKIFAINAAKADLVFVSADATRYGLIYATPGDETQLPDSRESLLSKIRTISKSKTDPAATVQDFAGRQGVAVSGSRYVMGRTFEYVGFQKQLPGVEVEVILGSPERKAIKLFEDLEVILDRIESAPVRKSREAKTAIAIYEEYNQAVVLVQAFDKNRNLLAFGTGFNVAAEGLIVTNLHVLAGGASSYIIIKFPYHGEFQEAVIAGVSDPQTDLALLEIKGNNLPAIDQIYKPEVEIGEKVYVIGNPQGLINTLSPGILSGIRDKDGVQLFQITAPISGGSSGGPVFNEYGEVVCVAAASHQGGQNLNFCIPIDQVEKVRRASDLQSGRIMQDKPVNSALAKISAEIDLTQDGSLPQFQHPGEVKKTILAAIDEGAALFNQGDTDGCYRVYERAAKQILYTIDPTDNSNPKMQNIWRIVNTTRQVALRSPGSAKAAWVLRYGFDIILKRA